MSWKIFFLAATIFFGGMICGCSADEAKAENLPEKIFADLVEEVLREMKLSEKIGQMMMIGVQGKSLDDDSRFMLSQYHIGGIIFFDRNMETREQVKNFADELQTAAEEKVPLFIALDEEGGRVARMRNNLPPPPSQEKIGRSGDINLAETYAATTAEMLRSIGVNLNFAPVADVGSRDTRSFGDDAATVAEFVSSAAKGYTREKFFYCLKHFPGIGRSKIDPHKDVSAIEVEKKILDSEDLPPFKKIISEQDNSKFMIMVSHLKYPALDPENSASLSPIITTGLLRNELGFTGVIITDDLDMGAISNYYDFENLGVQAVKAGADIVLSCHDYSKQQKIYLGILSAVERGEISESRIDESVRRILEMKFHLQGD